MSEDGVVGSTMTEFKRHPVWIVGGVVVLVVLFLVLSGGKKTAASPQAFSFSYGPSDAQVQAGTALAIQQSAGQTQLALAGINASTSTAETQSYIGYLANNSANALAATQANDMTAVDENTTNNQTAVAASNNNLTALLSGQNYATQTAALNANAATTIAAAQYSSADYVAQTNASTDLAQTRLVTNEQGYAAQIAGNVAANATNVAANVAVAGYAYGKT